MIGLMLAYADVLFMFSVHLIFCGVCPFLRNEFRILYVNI